MILNPHAVLAELVKFQRIVNYSKMAIDRLAKGQPVEDIRDILKVCLNECAFTQIVSAGPATSPLNSVTAYIDKPEILKTQIAEAEAFVESIIEKIKDEVGPFYSKSQVMKFDELGDVTLNDQVWASTMEPIKVNKYIDPSSGIATQVDWEHGQYRTAKDRETFGPWKFFIR